MAVKQLTKITDNQKLNKDQYRVWLDDGTYVDIGDRAGKGQAVKYNPYDMVSVEGVPVQNTEGKVLTDEEWAQIESQIGSYLDSGGTVAQEHYNYGESGSWFDDKMNSLHTGAVDLGTKVADFANTKLGPMVPTAITTVASIATTPIGAALINGAMALARSGAGGKEGMSLWEGLDDAAIGAAAAYVGSQLLGTLTGGSAATSIGSGFDPESAANLAAQLGENTDYLNAIKQVGEAIASTGEDAATMTTDDIGKAVADAGLTSLPGLDPESAANLAATAATDAGIDLSKLTTAGTGTAAAGTAAGALGSTGTEPTYQDLLAANPDTSYTYTPDATTAATGTDASGILGTGLSYGDLLKTVAVGTPLLGALTTSTGDKTLSTTTTSGSATAKNAAETAWADFINDFYGVNGTKSAKDRTTEDTAYRTGLDNQYVKDITGAASPYLEALTNIQNQQNTGTGYYAPVSFGFGGQKMASFVPKTNQNLASSVLDTAKQKMTTDAGLLDLAKTTAATHTPNETANTYSTALGDLLTKLTSGSSSSTQTATVPTSSTWSNLLSGLTSAANVYSKLYPWQSTATPTVNINTGTGTSTADYATLLKSLLGGA